MQTQWAVTWHNRYGSLEACPECTCSGEYDVTAGIARWRHVLTAHAVKRDLSHTDTDHWRHALNAQAEKSDLSQHTWLAGRGPCMHMNANAMRTVTGMPAKFTAVAHTTSSHLPVRHTSAAVHHPEGHPLTTLIATSYRQCAIKQMVEH
jgi:hypothetical protein